MNRIKFPCPHPDQSHISEILSYPPSVPQNHQVSEIRGNREAKDKDAKKAAIH
jgi:hypothetical protein